MADIVNNRKVRELDNIDFASAKYYATVPSEAIALSCGNCAKLRTDYTKCFVLLTVCFSFVFVVSFTLIQRNQMHQYMSNIERLDSKLKLLQSQVSMLKRQQRNHQKEIYSHSDMKNQNTQQIQVQNIERDSSKTPIQETTKFRNENLTDYFKQNTRQRRELRRPKRQTSKQEKKLRKQCKRKKGITAVHFEGEGGEHYPDGTFHKWQLAEWALDTTLEDQFYMHFNHGKLEVKKGGLYLIYAQITMVGDPNQGFYIKRYHIGKEYSPDILAVCMLNYSKTPTMVIDHNKYLTCSTTGVFHLQDNDVIFIQHTAGKKVIASFNSTASFFGLVQLGDQKYMDLLSKCKNLPVQTKTKRGKRRKKSSSS